MVVRGHFLSNLLDDMFFSVLSEMPRNILDACSYLKVRTTKQFNLMALPHAVLLNDASIISLITLSTITTESNQSNWIRLD